ncbi:MAG: ester cyclase [Acidimicrobiales bacterium]
MDALSPRHRRHPDIKDLEGFKAFLRDDATAFPDNVQTITHIAAEGDLVGVFATYEGTHLGPLGPIPATGKRVKFDFFRCLPGA